MKTICLPLLLLASAACAATGGDAPEVEGTRSELVVARPGDVIQFHADAPNLDSETSYDDVVYTFDCRYFQDGLSVNLLSTIEDTGPAYRVDETIVVQDEYQQEVLRTTWTGGQLGSSGDSATYTSPIPSGMTLVHCDAVVTIVLPAWAPS